MKYCYKCGSQIESEDIFCGNCGAKQVEILQNKGEEVGDFNNSVNLNVKVDGQVVPNLSTSSNNNSVFSETGDILLEMLIRPVSGAKQFIEKGKKHNIIILTVLFAIIQGILGIWKVNQVLSKLEDTVIGFVKNMAYIINLVDPGSVGNKMPNISEIMEMTKEINKFKSFLNIPYGKIFLQNSIMFLLTVGILFIVTCLAINIISKNKIEASIIYKTVLIVLVPTLYFEIFSIIFSYLSFYIGIIVSVIGIIISLGCLTIVVKEKLLIDENYSVFIISVSYIIVIIGVLMCLGKFISSNMADVITSVINVVKNLGL